jgi:hypothetical protein
MTTALFLLRSKQIHFTLAELEEIPSGLVLDCFTESANDNYDYQPIATQADFDKF